MKIRNKQKLRLRKISILLVILLTILFPTYLTNLSNLVQTPENLQEDQNEINNDQHNETPILSLLGDDVWWNSSWKCRMIINVTNPYPYDFENYGLSFTFNYTNLAQNMQSNLNDIRIVENDILRKYYVKKDYPTTDMATVWFNTNINDTSPGDDIETDTYMYFGNEDALNAEAITPSNSFGWIKNGDFELDIDLTQYYDPYGWNFSHDPIDSIYGYSNPGVTDENSYGAEFANKLITNPTGAERVYSGNAAYKFGATPNTLSYSDVYNSYAGTFFSYPFTVPRVYGAGIDIHLYRNPRTWGFLRNGDLEEDGYYIRLCDDYGSDPDTHTDIGVGYENYAEIWGGRAFYTGPGGASRANNWQQETKLINIDDQTVLDTFSTLDSDGELTAPLNFTISNFEGDTIFLEFGIWGSEDKYRSGFFQLDDVRFNYTDFSTSLNELQYINSTATIITRDVDGRIVPNAEVMLVDSTLPKESPGYQIAYGISDSNGRVTFQDLENRRYNITVNYTLGSLEREVFNSYSSGKGPYYFNGIFYTEEIILDLWTIDFEIVDWDGIPLNLGYIEVNESDGGELLDTLVLDENGKAIFRWLNTSDYYFSVYYDNEDYNGDALLLNESSISRSNYDKAGVKYQEYSIWVNATNIDNAGDPSYSISEYIFTNGSRSKLGNNKIIKADISLTDMIDQLTDIKIYYVDKNNSTGSGEENLIYSKDGYGVGDDSDFIELDIPLIQNANLESENYEVYGLKITVNGINYSLPCNGIIEVDIIETCNIYNRTHLARLDIRTIKKEAGIDVPYPALIKVYDNETQQPIVNLTSDLGRDGYAYTAINDLPFWYLKDLTYNISINSLSVTNIEFNVSSLSPSDQWYPTDSDGVTWYNYTLYGGSSITFNLIFKVEVNITNYITAFFNATGTEEVFWGENLAFSANFSVTEDDGQTWDPITDPSAKCTLYVREIGSEINLLSIIMDSGSGAGNYSLTFNSSVLSAGGTNKYYSVRIEGSYPGYPVPNVEGFLILVKSIPTKISAHDYDTLTEVIDQSFTAYYNEILNFTIRYEINESGNPIDNAFLSYSWIGLTPVSFLEDPVNSGYYTFTIDTSDAQSTGLKIISISASLENYSTQENFLVYLNIRERITTLNGLTELVYLSPKIWVQDTHYFSFTYADANTLDIIGDLNVASFSWYELDEFGNRINGSQGSGQLIQNLNKTYYLDFNTEIRAVGFYFLHLAMQKENFEARFAYLNLEIKLREFDASITGVGSNNQIRVDQGDDVVVEVNLIDLSRGGIDLETAQITLNIGGVDYLFSVVTPGVYTRTLITSGIDTFFAPKTLVGKITIEMDNFTSQEISITVVVKMEEIFPGMPTFYFILITASIIGVVGSIVSYRVIQQARIPKHVKKIRKIKSYIKSSKKIPETISIPTKAAMLSKLFGDDWKVLGLSLSEVLGLEDLKSQKSTNKDKISKERGDKN